MKFSPPSSEHTKAQLQNSRSAKGGGLVQSNRRGWARCCLWAGVAQKTQHPPLLYSAGITGSGARRYVKVEWETEGGAMRLIREAMCLQTADADRTTKGNLG